MIRHNVYGDVESRAAMNKMVGTLAKVHSTHNHIANVIMIDDF